MAIHSRILAWRIPWTVESGELQSTGSHRVRHDGSHSTQAGWFSAAVWTHSETNRSSDPTQYLLTSTSLTSETAMDLVIVSPQKSHAETLIPDGTGFEGGAFGS